MTASNSARWLIGAMALLVPVVASADPQPATPTEDQVEAARVAYREARELHRQGKLKEALERALDAYRTAATPVTALEAGQILVELGRLVEARDVLRGVATMPVSPRESDKGRDARQQAAVLGGSLDPRIPKIAVAGRPQDVDVRLDGKPLASRDPTAWEGVDPGPHSLVVRADDKTCTTINITLAEGEARTIDLHDVAVSCRPASIVPVAPSAAAPIAPPPIAAAPPPSKSEPPPADASVGTLRWTGLAIAGAGVVAVGIGGYLALSAKSDYDAVSGECPARGCSTDGYDARQSARSRGDVATVTMGIGAAAIAGGALVWLFGSDAHGDATRASVAVGPGSLWLRVPLL
jgi:hypothetical protein